MKIGTKSLLFGVHQFLFHPYTIVRAWRKCYSRWPKWWELVAIVCHDWGYWGKPNMDGVEGQKHPERGATIARYFVWHVLTFFGDDNVNEAFSIATATYMLSLFHSTHYAAGAEMPVSNLYLPDKMSILYDPKWFYLLRARLSGEVNEYMKNAPLWVGTKGCRYWYDWYRSKIQNKWDIFKGLDIPS